MRLTAENRAFLKAHGLKINDAISMLIAQENDAQENGGTIFPAKVEKVEKVKSLEVLNG